MPCPCSLKCIIVQTISNHLSWAGEVCCAVLCEYFQILQRILPNCGNFRVMIKISYKVLDKAFNVL